MALKLWLLAFGKQPPAHSRQLPARQTASDHRNFSRDSPTGMKEAWRVPGSQVAAGSFWRKSEKRGAKSGLQKVQAPVDRCTRRDLLPLLPSGPGGVHRASLRGTSARVPIIPSCFGSVGGEVGVSCCRETLSFRMLLLLGVACPSMAQSDQDNKEVLGLQPTGPDSDRQRHDEIPVFDRPLGHNFWSRWRQAV